MNSPRPAETLPAETCRDVQRRSCEDFLHSHQGRASGTPPPGRWPRRKQGREGIGCGCVPETGTTKTDAGRWAIGRLRGRRPCRALSGGSPDGRAAAARSAAALPQVCGARRYAASMIAPAKRAWPRPPCPASCRRARSQSRALPAIASPWRWAQAPTLECDLPRQDLGTYRKDGGNQDVACRTPCITSEP